MFEDPKPGELPIAVSGAPSDVSVAEQISWNLLRFVGTAAQAAPAGSPRLAANPPARDARPAAAACICCWWRRVRCEWEAKEHQLLGLYRARAARGESTDGLDLVADRLEELEPLLVSEAAARFSVIAYSRITVRLVLKGLIPMVNGHAELWESAALPRGWPQSSSPLAAHASDSV